MKSYLLTLLCFLALMPSSHAAAHRLGIRAMPRLISGKADLKVPLVRDIFVMFPHHAKFHDPTKRYTDPRSLTLIDHVVEVKAATPGARLVDAIIVHRPRADAPIQELLPRQLSEAQLTAIEDGKYAILTERPLPYNLLSPSVVGDIICIGSLVDEAVRQYDKVVKELDERFTPKATREAWENIHRGLQSVGFEPTYSAHRMTPVPVQEEEE